MVGNLINVSIEPYTEEALLPHNIVVKFKVGHISDIFLYQHHSPEALSLSAFSAI